MTELEAVNILLSTIGEAPIDMFSTDATNEIIESAVARTTLAEVSRDVQSEGFSWNTDKGVKLVRDSFNQFLLPINQLRVTFDPRAYPSAQYTVRGNRVYDKCAQTFSFASPDSLTVSEMVVLLPWDDLPHQAQQYITTMAARLFPGRFPNGSAVYNYTLEDEANARAKLMRLEESGPRHNWLSGGEGLGINPYAPADGLQGRY